MANREEQLKQITEQLEQGVAEIFTSEKYTEYLNTMAKFHNYSFNNTLLIAMQKPEATLVAGYQAWQKKFNRQVKRGEKGIQIIAPAPFKEKQEIEKTDPETGEIVIGEDGQPETEVVERVITRFRVTTVFDVSQTTGEPIPEFEVSELDGDVLIYHDFMESLKMVAPVPIRFIEIDGEAKGFYQLVDKYIAIQPGMSEAQTMKTAVHETAHAVLHDRDQMEAEGIVKDQLTREVEAESVAYVVCNHFGLDTSEYSFSYIASWSSGKNMKELRASMDTIRKTSADMIGQIEEKLKELQIERAEQEADVVEQTEEMSAMQYAEQTINRLEQERTIFSNDQRNLIVNFAYKLDDREAMEKLAENLAESILDGNREAVQKLIGEAEEQIESLPDSMIGLSELHEAGFYSESMLPLTRERAVELHHEGVTVYGLTGAVGGQEQSQRIMNLELDILQHDGLFGVTKFEWENYRRSQETIMTPEEKAKIKETLLLESDGNRYGIYQINSRQEERGYQFLSLEAAKEMGFTVDGKDYQMVYSERLRDATTLDNLFERFNIERPNDFTGHSMSVSDVIIMNRGGRLTAYYVDSFGFTELPKFMLTLEGKENEIETELAVHIADRYILMHECEEGYDYSILDEQYHLLDGGVYDNPDITIQRAMDMVIADLKEPRFSAVTEQYYRDEYLQGEVYAGSEAEIVDFVELSEKAEEVEQADLEAKQAEFRENNPDVVADFRARTEELFHSLDGQSAEDIEKTVYAYVQSQIDEYGLDAKIVDVVVAGSRCRGIEQENSDLDVVVEYTGSTREDDLFNMLHEDSIYIAGIQVDINPITESRTGTLETYLPEVETYLQEKAQQEQINNQLVTQGREVVQEQNALVSEEKVLSELEKEPVIEPETVHITFTVAECGEFHNMGEYHEGIETIEEAMKLYNAIDPSRMHGIPSIGVNMHIVGTEEWEDEQADIVSGKRIDVDFLNYTPELRDTPKVQDAIKKLIAAYPEKDVIDMETKEQKIQTLAAELDQLSYEIDTYGYRDSVSDRESQIQMIADDIRTGYVKPLSIFLQASIDEGIDEDSERQAKELLVKLAEYKPLAKIEELEEQNYNMIDDRLNNGVEKFNREEEKKEQREKPQARSSLKERLAAKQKETTQGNNKDTKELEKSKNSHREM